MRASPSLIGTPDVFIKAGIDLFPSAVNIWGGVHDSQVGALECTISGGTVGQGAVLLYTGEATDWVDLNAEL